MAVVRCVCNGAAFLAGRLTGHLVAASLSALTGVGAMSGSETTVVGAVRVPVLETEEARNLLEAGREAGSLSADEITLALD